MARIILDDGTTYEVTGFGTPLKGDSYIRWDEETCDDPLVSEAAENHDSDATPRVLLKKVSPVQIIRRTGEQEYEISGIRGGPVQGSTEDTYVRKEGNSWRADVFDSSVKESDEAHRMSQNYFWLHEALADLLPITED